MKKNNAKIWVATLCIFGLMILPEDTSGHNLTTEEEIKEYQFPKEFQESFPFYLSGHDEEGAPVWVFEYGKWDVRSVVEKGGESSNNIDVWFDQMFLTFRDSAKETEGKDFIVIGDLEGFDLRQAGNFGTVGLILSKLSSAEKLLPLDTIKHVFLVNSNFLFDTLFERGKSLLGGIGQKVDVFGTNKEKWIPKVLRLIPKDQLPEWYGGNKEWTPLIVKG